MTELPPSADFHFDKDRGHYLCKGKWSTLSMGDIVSQFEKTALPTAQTLTIDGSALESFDSAGALALIHCIDALKKHNNQVELTQFNTKQQALLKLIETKKDA